MHWRIGYKNKSAQEEGELITCESIRWRQCPLVTLGVVVLGSREPRWPAKLSPGQDASKICSLMCSTGTQATAASVRRIFPKELQFGKRNKEM